MHCSLKIKCLRRGIIYWLQKLLSIFTGTPTKKIGPGQNGRISSAFSLFKRKYIFSLRYTVQRYDPQK